MVNYFPEWEIISLNGKLFPSMVSYFPYLFYSRQVSLRTGLERGQYLIMPTTFEPGEEATFTFRVFSRHPVRIRIIDVSPCVTGQVFARARQPNAGPPVVNNNNKLKDFSHYEPLFNQVADERRTINCFELQDLLETCLPNGK